MQHSLLARLFAPIASLLLMLVLLTSCSLQPSGHKENAFTPYALLDAHFDDVSLDFSDKVSNARSVIFSPDGTELYVVGRGTTP